MNLLDANVLLYAVNQEAPRHVVSRHWIEAALSGTRPVGFAWVSVLAFLRLSTKPGLFPRPLEVVDAAEQVRRWLQRSTSVVVEPTSRHLDILTGLLAESGAGGNLVNDAHLGALAIEHNATVVSFDRDFARFAGVRWEEPA